MNSGRDTGWTTTLKGFFTVWSPFSYTQNAWGSVLDTVWQQVVRWAINSAASALGTKFMDAIGKPAPTGAELEVMRTTGVDQQGAKAILAFSRDTDGKLALAADMLDGSDEVYAIFQGRLSDTMRELEHALNTYGGSMSDEVLGLLSQSKSFSNWVSPLSGESNVFMNLNSIQVGEFGETLGRGLTVARNTFGNKILMAGQKVQDVVKKAQSPFEWFSGKIQKLQKWIGMKEAAIDKTSGAITGAIKKLPYKFTNWFLNQGDDVLFSTVIGGQSLHLIWATADYLVTGRTFMFTNTYDQDPYGMIGSYF
jgi:hypothetical protein